MTSIRDRAIALYDAFTHEHGDRRAFMAQMIALAGSAAAAEALIAGIAASPAAAAVIDPADRRLKTSKDPHALPGGGTIRGYMAVAAARTKPVGAVMVIHENRGLTPHIEDVARRVALAGFVAFVPDFLSSQGGTPANEDEARTLIGKADLAAITAQASAVVAMLAKAPGSNGRVGTVGFCWGGALVDRVAVAAPAPLAAAVSYYGPAPASAEAVKVQAAMLLHYAGKDARVNATGLPWAEALKAAGKTVEAHVYDGVDHAFNNDTSAERYNAQAAALAWDRTAAFFHRHLDREA